MATEDLLPATRLPDFGFGRAVSRFDWRIERPQGGSAAGREAASREPSPAEQRAVRELQNIDRRVRAHESAHLNAGDGVVSGGPSLSYIRGPDGRQYAVGGEVPIDTSPGRTAEETLIKAEAIRRAALAPADPSAQDRRVAAMAARMAAEADAELAAAGRRGEPARDAASSGDRLALYRKVERAPAESGGQLLAIA